MKRWQDQCSVEPSEIAELSVLGYRGLRWDDRRQLLESETLDTETLH